VTGAPDLLRKATPIGDGVCKRRETRATPLPRSYKYLLSSTGGGFAEKVSTTKDYEIEMLKMRSRVT
jgi:hypothetical protein